MTSHTGLLRRWSGAKTMSEFRLTPDMIGMNNYSDYDPKYCDGEFCPRDCDICGRREENREDGDE